MRTLVKAVWIAIILWFGFCTGRGRIENPKNSFSVFLRGVASVAQSVALQVERSFSSDGKSARRE